MSAGRRDFLKTLSIAGAGFAGGTLNAPKVFAQGQNVSQSTNESADVIIVGGGFAGLTTANRLVQSGLKVIVLEARDRLGGRTKTESFTQSKIKLDVGGQWIGPTQDYVLNMIKKFKVETFKTPDDGLTLVETEQKNGKGTFHSYPARPGLTQSVAIKIFKATALDFSALYDGLDKLASTVNLQKPWLTPNADYFDSMTLHTWMEVQVAKLGPIEIKKVDERIRNLFRGVIHTVFSTDPKKISMLHAMFYIKSGGGLDSLINVTNGAQDSRFKLGTENLVQKLAESIQGSVRLNQQVKTIEQSASGVIVTTQSAKYRAKKIVVAVPPTLASRIDYSPKLSSDRDQLTQSYPMGSTIKVIAIYKTPFWRNSTTGAASGKLSGQAFSPYRAITATFDNSHPDHTEGILVGFIIGPNAEKLRRLPAEERRQAALEALKEYFGNEALTPLDYEEHDWSQEEFSRGCYVGYLPPGIWTSLGEALTRPEGHIHWAGTETSDVWNGYIDGAIRSGYRAAHEIVSAIKG